MEEFMLSLLRLGRMDWFRKKSQLVNKEDYGKEINVYLRPDMHHTGAR
jgi:hypothetical protein